MTPLSLRWAEVDLGAVSANCALILEHLPKGTQLFAVVKANGYGHGAVPVAHVHQLLLRARAQGLQTPGEWAEAASRILRSQAKGVTKDGKPVPAAETVAELTVEASTFVERQLPVLRALHVA